MYSNIRAVFAAVFFALSPFFFMQSGVCASGKEYTLNGKEDSFHFVPFDPAVQKELVIVDFAHTCNLNPHTANYSFEAQILNGLYEGLFSYDPLTLDPLPAAAESFRVSRDQKRWTFTLRPDLRFSNGDPIEAEDVRRSWLMLLNPAVNAPFASLLDCVQGVSAYRGGTASGDDIGIKVKNKNTLVLYLDKPAKHLPKILCHHAFAVVHPDKNVFTGAFVLKKYGREELVLEKNLFYYNAAQVALPSIRIVIAADRQENTFSFNTGKVQWVRHYIDAEKIYNRRDVLVYPQFGTEFLFFKASVFPWNNSLVRKAVLSAIPWEKLRQDDFVPAETLILPLQEYPKIYGVTDYDVEEAERLLSQALRESEKISGKKAQAPVLTLAIPDSDYAKKQAALIADSLTAIGIHVRVQTSPADSYLESFNDRKADMFTYTWIGDFADPLAFLELFRADSSLRATDWKDVRFDNLLEDAALITDDKERYQKLGEAEQFLLDEGIVLPVSHPVSLNALDRNLLGGWFVNALDIHPFKYLYFTEASEREGFI